MLKTYAHFNIFALFLAKESVCSSVCNSIDGISTYLSHILNTYILSFFFAKMYEYKCLSGDSILESVTSEEANKCAKWKNMLGLQK